MKPVHLNIRKMECSEGRPVVLLLCAAEAATMAPVFGFPAMLPHFVQSWGLTGADAGWVSGITFAGYAAAVPFLSALTDRIDARRVYVAGAVLAGLASLLFAFAAGDFWSALALRALTGFGLAGTYMPGLKALVDRTGGPQQPRWISWYTAGFSLGTALSFLAAGLLESWIGPQYSFVVLGVVALAAAVLVQFGLAPAAPAPPAPGAFLDLRPILRNRRVMAYVLGYFAHMWELFGLRNWMVAFLTFTAIGHTGAMPVNASGAAALSSAIAMAASIGGAAWALRFDRARACAAFGLASAAGAVLVGLSADWGYWPAMLLVLAYNGLVQLDSAALTTGAVLAADAARRGAGIAVHSLVGFAGGFLGPLAFGWVLDMAGGPNDPQAWFFAFLSLGGAAALGPPILLHLARR
jgi:predicted MFS family arabinose efflux permease